MKIATIALIGTAAVTFSAALAQQDLTGTITMIDRIDHNVVIQRPQNGTVGTSGGTGEWLKVQAGLSLDNVHAGDRVSYAITETGGIKTVTKLERQ
jgi:Copper binding periplasmic protein CusF